MENKRTCPIGSWIKFILPLLFFLIPNETGAQYYYQEIYSTNLIISKQILCKKLRVHREEITSLDGSGKTTSNFSIKKIFLPNYLEDKTTTRSITEGSTILTIRFDSLGKMISTKDSSVNGINKTDYSYYKNGRVNRIAINSTSPDNMANSSFRETHEYLYNPDGTLWKMIRVRNKNDTTLVVFKSNQNGDIIREKESGKEIPVEIFYYSYNEYNQLTDIGHYNHQLNRIIPYRMFDYNEQGQLSKMTILLSGSTGYNLWKYKYNELGLKTREDCYERGRILIGSVIYHYQF